MPPRSKSQPRDKAELAWKSAADMTWPDTGPAVITGQAGEHIYRMPTLMRLGALAMGSVPADRSPVEFRFAFTEDGTAVTYTAEMSQDDLFNLLWAAGVLERAEVT
jgi:hypothetical protein